MAQPPPAFVMASFTESSPSQPVALDATARAPSAHDLPHFASARDGADASAACPAELEELTRFWAEILSYLASELTQHRPDDPLDFLLNSVLTFPFASPSVESCVGAPLPTTSASHFQSASSASAGGGFAAARVKPATLCAACCEDSSQPSVFVSLSAFASPRVPDCPCCAYALHGAFRDGAVLADESVAVLSRFLNSNESFLVIVGDDNEALVTAQRRAAAAGAAAPSSHGPTSTPPAMSSTAGLSGAHGASHGRRCDCLGAGKTRLCRWLDFPGRYVHRRKVLRIDAGKASNLLEFLESVESESHHRSLGSAAALGDRGGGGGGGGGFTNKLSELSLLINDANTGSFASPHRVASVLSPSPPTGDGSGRRRASIVTAPSPKRALERGPAAPAPELTGGAGADAGVAPTLTLIDGIEPPHYILHALLQHSYFRAERLAVCARCGNASDTAQHKTILFTRSGVFFKFPLPCAIYTMRRVPLGEFVDDGVSVSVGRAAPGFPNVSFTEMVGPAHDSPSSHPSGSGGGVLYAGNSATPSRTSPSTSPSASPICPPAGVPGRRGRRYRVSFGDSATHGGGGGGGVSGDRFGSAAAGAHASFGGGPAGGVAAVRIHRERPLESGTFRVVLGELAEHFNYTRRVEGQRGATFSIEVSETFARLALSRGQGELALAQAIIEFGLEPPIDLSELPDLVSCLVTLPRSDVYITRLLRRVLRGLRHKGVGISRLLVGNLLCLVVASQQRLSAYAPPATATDMLQLYLDLFTFSSSSPSLSLSAGAGAAAAAVLSPSSSFGGRRHDSFARASPPAGYGSQAQLPLLSTPGDSTRHPQVSFASPFGQPDESVTLGPQPSRGNSSFTSQPLPLSPTLLGAPSQPQQQEQQQQQQQQQQQHQQQQQQVADTLTYLNLQNIVIERVRIPGKARGVPLVAQNLLDARGADIAPDLLQLLVRGTTMHSYRRQNHHLHQQHQQHQQQQQQQQLQQSGSIRDASPALAASTFALASTVAPPVDHGGPACTPDASSTDVPLLASIHRLEAEGGGSSGGHHRSPAPAAPAARAPTPRPAYGHPVLLLSDVTDVGRHGYEGQATAALAGGGGGGGGGRKSVRAAVLDCFVVKLGHDGLSVVLTVEKSRVVAETTFAKPDTDAEDDDGGGDDASDGRGGRVLWTLLLQHPTKCVVRASLLSQDVPVGGDDAVNDNDLLLLQLLDGSACLVAVNNIPRGTTIAVSRRDSPPPSVWNSDSAAAVAATAPRVRFVSAAPPRGVPPPQPSQRAPRRNASPAATAAAAAAAAASMADSPPCSTTEVSPRDHGPRTQRSWIRHDSRVTVDVPRTPISDLGSSGLIMAAHVPNDEAVAAAEAALLEQQCDRSIALVTHDALQCEDPQALCASESYVAAASQDSDIVVVVANPFKALAPPKSPRPVPSPTVDAATSVTPAPPPPPPATPPATIVQTEANVASLLIVKDRLLVVGLVDGLIQGFALPTGQELFAFAHHEGRINVLRSMATPSGPNAVVCASGRTTRLRLALAARVTHFIAGSEDSTMTIFCADDKALVRTIRFHKSPIIDIAAANFFDNRVLISCDRGCTVVVSSVTPDDLQRAGGVLWTSALPGVRSLSLSVDASWLVCSRLNNSPVALPISEWARHGTGQFHSRPVSALHITADEAYLLTGGEDGTVFVWDMVDNYNYVSSFRQHASATISAITTSSDSARVASSDISKFIYLWRRACGTVLRIVNRGSGGFACFIAFDYLLVQTGKGLKVFDNEDKLFVSTSGLATGALDVYMMAEEDYALCFAANEPHPVRPASAARPAAQQVSSSLYMPPLPLAPLPLPPHRVPSTSSSTTEEPIELVHTDELETAPATVIAVPEALDMSASQNPIPERMRRLCFIGAARSNPDGGRYSVEIFSLRDLGTPRRELIEGEVEDEFGDECSLHHTDVITAFTFLQRPTLAAAAAGPGSRPPTVFLAATGSEDQLVILWDWRRQHPLRALQHTHFVTRCCFWDPNALCALRRASAAATGGYTAEDLAFLAQHDPGYQRCSDGALVCNLVTAQYADSEHNTTLRVFEIRESVRAFQKRLLAHRCGRPLTAATYDTRQLEIAETSRSPCPNARCSVRCLAVRPSDALICTGHDESCEVVFWKWFPERPLLSRSADLLQSPSASTPAGGRGSQRGGPERTPPRRRRDGGGDVSGDESSSSGDEETKRAEAVITMRLRPLRRIASRI